LRFGGADVSVTFKVLGTCARELGIYAFWAVDPRPISVINGWTDAFNSRRANRPLVLYAVGSGQESVDPGRIFPQASIQLVIGIGQCQSHKIKAANWPGVK